MVYKTKYSNLFVNLIFKDGKKSKVQKLLIKFFIDIRSIGINPGFIFIKALSNAMPVVGIKKKKLKGKIVNIPKFISKQQKSAIGLKWIIQNALKKKNKFNNNLAKEFIETADFKSISYKKKLEISIFLEKNIIQN